MSWQIGVQQEYHTRVLCNSVSEECLAGAPESGVLQECPTGVSQKSGLRAVSLSVLHMSIGLTKVPSRCNLRQHLFQLSMYVTRGSQFVCPVIPSPSHLEAELARSFISNKFSDWSRQKLCQLYRHRFLTWAVTLFLCAHFLYHRSMIHVQTTVSLGWSHRSGPACGTPSIPTVLLPGNRLRSL